MSEENVVEVPPLSAATEAEMTAAGWKKSIYSSADPTWTRPGFPEELTEEDAGRAWQLHQFAAQMEAPPAVALPDDQPAPAQLDPLAPTDFQAPPAVVFESVPKAAPAAPAGISGPAYDCLPVIGQLTQEANRQKARVTKINERLQHARGAYKAAVDKLLKACEEATAQLPLFEHLTCDEDEDADLAPVCNPGLAQLHDLDDSWRGQALKDIFYSLPSGVNKAFEEAEITTLGELADYSKNHQLTEIPGIGAAKAERVDQALAEFWQRRAAV